MYETFACWESYMVVEKKKTGRWNGKAKMIVLGKEADRGDIPQMLSYM